eukprot:CAMPEP_0168819716 /NCGR_PEP_ID=MMETSP0726-20121227/8450_1 /TAXON_ID=265536 /ORGANISM="Amphiprora sp., Strain CCMP467" /LENGTH=128 /DNA_ID=CAMNT_0008872151 /DNA_START=35 /DNA_END=421 /DNA_ORIENTATION=+
MTFVEYSAPMRHWICFPPEMLRVETEDMASTSKKAFVHRSSNSGESPFTHVHSRMCGFSGSSKPKVTTSPGPRIQTNSSIRLSPRKDKMIGPISGCAQWNAGPLSLHASASKGPAFDSPSAADSPCSS